MNWTLGFGQRYEEGKMQASVGRRAGESGAGGGIADSKRSKGQGEVSGLEWLSGTLQAGDE